MRHMRAILGLALALGACGDDDGGADDTPDATVPLTGAIGYDVTHYDFSFDLATRVATVAIDLQTTSAGDCVTFAFKPDAHLGVTLGGVPAARVDIATTTDTLTACDPAGLGFPSGTTLALAVTAEVPEVTLATSDVGFGHQSDRALGQVDYLVSWVKGCDRHGACDARSDDFATYSFHVTHGASTQVLCSGTVTVAAGVTSCELAVPAPSYSSFGLIARTPAWTETPLAPWGGVAVSIFDYPNTQVAAQFDVPAISGHFLWMVDTFGAYPYGDELRFVVGPTYWAGFEHPGNIVLSEFLATGTSSYFDGLTHTTMHEVAHQWAGDNATLADLYDFVWKEAMAEYLTFVYEDEQLPPEVGLATAKAWKSFSVNAGYYLVPDERPELFEYYGDVYGPGPMILFRQLETMYSRAEVIAALQMLIGTGAPRALSVMDVRAALEATTGADLGAYFDAWAFGAGAPPWPEITTSVTDLGGGMYQLAVSSTTADSVPRGAAFTVRLKGAVAGEQLDVLVSNGPSGGAYPTMNVSPAFVPVSVEIDPLAQALVFPAGSGKPAEERVRVEPWRVRD